VLILLLNDLKQRRKGLCYVSGNAHLYAVWYTCPICVYLNNHFGMVDADSRWQASLEVQGKVIVTWVCLQSWGQFWGMQAFCCRGKLVIAVLYQQLVAPAVTCCDGASWRVCLCKGKETICNWWHGTSGQMYYSRLSLLSGFYLISKETHFMLQLLCRI
jgi:hypothetical protein